VVWASSSFTYTHEKCVILDGKEAWIMTMNATQTSASSNREYLAVDDDASDVAEADTLFQADYANLAYQPKGNLLVAPVNARNILLQFIATAHTTIDLEGEEFSDYQIAPAIAQMAKQGVKVRIVIATDTSPTQSQTDAINTVKQAGCSVVATSTPYIHAKVLVVDGTQAYVGSANFSGGSLGYNRELGVLIDNNSEVAKIHTPFETDFANGTPQ
jgi:phosphatidylserine/phosphatidylglycerophosphate/cardiolipin synthase-like enzyme